MVLLISEGKIKSEGVLNNNVSAELILSSIKIAQDQGLQPIIGTNLYKEIQSLIEEGVICDEDNKNYKYLVDEYITPYLLYKTIEEIQIPLSFQMRNIGTYTKNVDGVENTMAVSLSDLKYIKQFYANKAEFYGKRMADYICCNITQFPEYTSSSNKGDMGGDLKNVYRSNLNI